MSKSAGRWFKAVIAVLVAGAAWAAFTKFREPNQAGPRYRTATVARGDVRQLVTASGQIEPVVNLQVGSQISGTIEKIFVDFNSAVTNGQVLAQIDPASYKTGLKQAQGELANAEASLELTRINARRAEELFRNNLISQSDHDQAMADLRQAQAIVQIREANVEKVQVDLNRTTIYSSIDGIVISRNVEVGQTVAASFNTPTLFTIANDLSEMRIHASVSEADIGGVAAGQPVEFSVDAFPTKRFSGVVEQVRNAAITNQNVITYTTVIGVMNPESKLKPGMTANVSITLADQQDVLKIPNAAFRFNPPEGAAVEGRPASQTLSSAAPGTAVMGAAGPSGGGGPPGADDERRQRMLERFDRNGDGQLDESERAAQRAAMAGRFGGGGGGGSGEGFVRGGPGRGGARAGGAAATALPEDRTVYRIAEIPNAAQTAGGGAPVLKAVTVKTGITDGAFTEVKDGLEEGEVVVIGTELGTSASGVAAPQNNPFGPRFPGRR